MSEDPVKKAVGMLDILASGKKFRPPILGRYGPNRDMSKCGRLADLHKSAMLR